MNYSFCGYLLVELLGIELVALLFVDHCQVEHRCRVLFFLDSNLEIVDCFIEVFHVFIKEETQVEVSLKIVWVYLQRLLIQRVDLVIVALGVLTYFKLPAIPLVFVQEEVRL